MIDVFCVYEEAVHVEETRADWWEAGTIRLSSYRVGRLTLYVVLPLRAREMFYFCQLGRGCCSWLCDLENRDN